MIEKRKLFYILSTLLIIFSIVAILVFKLPLGIDFKGGSFMEIRFLENEVLVTAEDDIEILPESEDVGTLEIPSREKVIEILSEFDLGDMSIQQGGDNSLFLRFRDVDEETHQQILSKLDDAIEANFVEEQFQSVGPIIGTETIRKSLWAMALVLIMIVAYVSWAFRRISYPIGSFRYGIIALITLFHDVLITVGFFSVFTYFKGTEIGVTFIAALLTIVGYSVNDTIVIFDRVRENILRFGSQRDFEDLVSASIKESVVRSLNTSLTTLFVLFAVFLFGGSTIHNFVFTLIVGISIGTYSSLFIASPIIVTWANSLRAKK